VNCPSASPPACPSDGCVGADAAGNVTSCSTFGSAGTVGDLAWALAGGIALDVAQKPLARMASVTDSMRALQPLRGASRPSVESGQVLLEVGTVEAET
jgi:hypothetical protein